MERAPKETAGEDGEEEDAHGMWAADAAAEEEGDVDRAWEDAYHRDMMMEEEMMMEADAFGDG